MTTKIAIQGEKASFHDIATDKFYGATNHRIFCETFDDVFRAVKSGQAEVAVCAIENSLYGSINDVYDLLLKNNFHIIGEVYLRIEQCLIGLPGTDIGSIREVYSHPVALAQCEDYLDTTVPGAKRLESHDTAGSVAIVKELNDPSVAAIASREAAELHGLVVLAESIETHKQNYTRFVVIGRDIADRGTSTKTSLIVRTGHHSGALYDVLGSFAQRSINLTKLQSRPIIGKAWHYMFYIDVEAGSDNPQLQQALADLTRQKCDVRVLGSYVAGERAIEF